MYVFIDGKKIDVFSHFKTMDDGFSTAKYCSIILFTTKSKNDHSYLKKRWDLDFYKKSLEKTHSSVQLGVMKSSGLTISAWPEASHCLGVTGLRPLPPRRLRVWSRN